jgi:protein-S-isoprenylcysteine O-methyltransferase Ste14
MDSKKAEFGDLAYQKMIKTGVAGVFLIPAVIFHAFTSVRSLPPGPPANDITTLWSQSLLPMIGVPSEIDIIIRLILFGLFLVIGLLLVRSSISTFGLDYMVVVYLYFPEESEIQENEIYSVVRHPAYLAGVILGIAALFLRFSVYSIVFCLIVYILFKLHLRTEEAELVERFGDGFIEYMEKVPAFFVSPRNYGKFFRFLRQGI